MPIGASVWGPPLIGAAASWGLGKLGLGSPAKVGPTSPTFRRAEQIGDLSKNFAFDYALPTAEKAYGDVLPYYEGLLSGNRADIASKLQPEFSTINSQFDQAAKSMGQFTPQGGGQTSALSELPFKKIAAQENLINTVRPQAASQLGQLAGQITGEGLQAGGLSLNAVADQLNTLLGKASQDIPLQQQTGAGIYSILQQLLGQQGGGVSTGFPGDVIPGGIPGGAPQLPGGGDYGTMPMPEPPIG